MRQNIKQLFNEALYSVGIPALSLDTCARIYAVLYVHGNREEFVLNANFTADIRYIQKRYHISGGEIPDAGFVSALRKYIKILEEYEREHKNDRVKGCLFKPEIPSWAAELFKYRYDIRLH